DRIEWTFSNTDPAADACFLANHRLRGLRIDPDDLGARALGRAERNALEMTALRLTSVLEHDRDAHGNSMRRELFKRMRVGAGGWAGEPRRRREGRRGEWWGVVGRGPQGAGGGGRRSGLAHLPSDEPMILERVRSVLGVWAAMSIGLFIIVTSLSF